MLRAAGLDWFEQGDAWAKVAALRPAAQARAVNLWRWEGLSRGVRRLMTVDASSVPGLLPKPWLAAFETAGHGSVEHPVGAPSWSVSLSGLPERKSTFGLSWRCLYTEMGST